MTPTEPPAYLQPYLAAERRYGAGFGTLLWASPRTQGVRFDALIRAAGGGAIRGRRVLDVGCGRADLLDHLVCRGVVPRAYVGIEAVEALAAAAERKRHANATVLRGDFVARPELVRDAAADVVLISGALNTMDAATFYACVRTAHAAAGEAVVFNFLASTRLASAAHLTWHHPDDVRAFAAKLSDHVGLWDDYLPGDATMVIRKGNPER